MLSLLLILIPLAGSLLTLSVKGRLSVRAAQCSAWVSALLTVFAACRFQAHPDDFRVQAEWVRSLGIGFALSVNGLNIILLLLTGLLTPFLLLASAQNRYSHEPVFYALVLLMQASLFGVFLAADGFVFYVFYELALIPIYFIGAVWGGKNRIRITLKFFLYTLIGSLLMLAAIIFLGVKAHSFSIPAWYHLSLTATEQTWIFWAFFLAFAVKIPIFPFHSWQPDTYTDAPVGGTMLLSGIMLKMGLYGLLIFILPLTPLALHSYGTLAMVLCVTGIIYASVIALKQDDMKTLIAYSSIAHVGLIAAGLLSGTQQGIQGALLQMLNHGISVVALFFCIDFIERNTGTRLLSQLGGISNRSVRFAVFFMVVLLGSVGLPLTNGFIGEFLLLFGIYQWSAWMALFAGTTIILGAVYMLRLYKLSFLGEASPASLRIPALNPTAYLLLIPLCAAILFLGIYPNSLLQLSDAAVHQFLSLLS